MASPTAPDDPPDTEGEGLLETIGAQLAALAAQVSEIDQRMASVESGSPSQPLEVQLSPETVAQIADALAALQAAGSQALDEAFKTASDDLTEALSGLVRAEISRTLSDAGYTVEVSEAAEPALGEAVEPSAADELLEHDADSGSDALAMPTIVAPLASSSVGPAESESDSEVESEGDAVDADRPPLGLDELDDPFLDALIRKEPLSA
ncbi:hypothetical protein [Candidatus Poriferisodalis sp.]|uniref:hypothetical protein n=1 Tax=Candidatus Poriferisodalis sp. TaxID=3101277 RepID=UPI003B02452D